MEIRKSKPPKHTPELLQKAEAAVQSAFFGIRDAISAQRKKMQQKPLPKSEPESKPVSSMAHKVSSWNPDEESFVPHVVPAQRRRIRYDRILLAALLCCLIVFLCIYAFKCSTQSDKPQMLAANAPVAATEEAAEEATVTTTTTLSPEQIQQRHTVYEKTIAVVGDSIASGFELYDFIPAENGLAKGCVAIRNIHDFTFEDENGVEKDIIDVLQEKQPPYIYMSMGMNDINLLSADEYTQQYTTEIGKIQAVCPDSDIIVAGITPITPSSTFSSNTTIQQYNAALEQAITQLGKENVAYFDAFSIVVDPATGGLADQYSAGDGVHLGTASYPALLEALYPLLDQMPAPPGFPELEQQILSAETTASGETTTETLSDARGN